MPSETQNIIKNIMPLLTGLGWSADSFEYEVSCPVGQIDILYTHKGKKIAVIEAKRVGVGEKTALPQAKKYAKSLNIPLAIATDGDTFLHAYHIKKDAPLLNHSGEQISIDDFTTLTIGNLLHFVRNPSLRVRVKTEGELSALFAQLNDSGRAAGLTSGVERLQEIAKLVFIKMLVDNQQHLDHTAWDSVMEEQRERKINLLNYHIDTIRQGGIELEDIQIHRSKSGVVAKMMEVLHNADFNHVHYDANSTLFQDFLSERARGGGTNDLGQYFTPHKIISLMYSLSDYALGETVYDPFCGTAGVLCEFFIRQEIATDSEKKEFGKKFLFGSEISKPVANLAKMNMVLVGDGHSNILAMDSIISQNKYMETNKQFDHVVTNIPFDPKTPSDGVPRGYFTLSHDGSEVANFVEHCINRCKPRGKIVLIVGRGFLTEKKSTNFRKRLLRKYDIEAVYDLYDGIFDPYTMARACLFVIAKQPPASDKTIDFFSIKNDECIAIAEDMHDSPRRYGSDYYQIAQSIILENEICDLRGRVYESKPINSNTHCRLGDLVRHIPKSDTKLGGGIPDGKKRLVTPNSIQGGIRMIGTRTKSRVSGYGSFIYELQKDAIVVARISKINKQAAQTMPYLGSALVGNDAGQLTYDEYYQFVPKDHSHTFYILYHLRTKQCQDIAEWTSGTSWQQRIDVKFILNQPIPIPTPAGIKRAEDVLNSIEERLQRIAKCRQEINKIAAKF